MEERNLDNMEIFIECTRKSILSWIIMITEGFREELPEELAMMIGNKYRARKRVLRFMLAFLNEEFSDEAIKVAVRACSRYDKTMAMLVSRNLHILQGVSDDDIHTVSSDLVVLNELQIERAFHAEIRQVADYYTNNDFMEELKYKVKMGLEGFGLWIHEFESQGGELAMFNTDIFISSDGLGLSCERCIEYHHFFASKVVEYSNRQKFSD